MKKKKQHKCKKYKVHVQKTTNPDDMPDMYRDELYDSGFHYTEIDHIMLAGKHMCNDLKEKLNLCSPFVGCRNYTCLTEIINVFCGLKFHELNEEDQNMLIEVEDAVHFLNGEEGYQLHNKIYLWQAKLNRHDESYDLLRPELLKTYNWIFYHADWNLRRIDRRFLDDEHILHLNEDAVENVLNWIDEMERKTCRYFTLTDTDKKLVEILKNSWVYKYCTMKQYRKIKELYQKFDNCEFKTVYALTHFKNYMEYINKELID